MAPTILDGKTFEFQDEIGKQIRAKCNRKCNSITDFLVGNRNRFFLESSNRNRNQLLKFNLVIVIVINYRFVSNLPMSVLFIFTDNIMQDMTYY